MSDDPRLLSPFRMTEIRVTLAAQRRTLALEPLQAGQRVYAADVGALLDHIDAQAERIRELEADGQQAYQMLSHLLNDWDEFGPEPLEELMDEWVRPLLARRRKAVMSERQQPSPAPAEPEVENE